MDDVVNKVFDFDAGVRAPCYRRVTATVLISIAVSTGRRRVGSCRERGAADHFSHLFAACQLICSHVACPIYSTMTFSEQHQQDSREESVPEGELTLGSRGGGHVVDSVGESSCVARHLLEARQVHAFHSCEAAVVSASRRIAKGLSPRERAPGATALNDLEPCGTYALPQITGGSEPAGSQLRASARASPPA